MSSFTKKVLRFTFVLSDGVFNSTGDNVLTIQGLAATCRITSAGNLMAGLDASIFGMSESDMHELSTLALISTLGNKVTAKNTVQVEAGDGKTMKTVFYGDIYSAWAEYQSAPDVYLHISANASLVAKTKAAPISSYKGAVSVAVIFADLAKQAGLIFEDGGVNRKVTNPYLTGSSIDQAKELAKQVNCDIAFENKKMLVTPKGKSIPVDEELIYQLSERSGLVGYPTFDNIGLTFTALYTPDIQLFKDVALEMPKKLSQKTKAEEIGQSNNNTVITSWRVNKLDLILNALIPYAPWFIQGQASSVKNRART